MTIAQGLQIFDICPISSQFLHLRIEIRVGFSAVEKGHSMTVSQGSIHQMPTQK
jgi:hypothetical protein